jgi:hypothetical protein
MSNEQPVSDAQSRKGGGCLLAVLWPGAVTAGTNAIRDRFGTGWAVGYLAALIVVGLILIGAAQARKAKSATPPGSSRSTNAR